MEGKNSSLNDSRMQRLESVGFRWAKRKGQVSWNEKFVSAYLICHSLPIFSVFIFLYSNTCFSFAQEELKAYKRKHGNVSVNTTILQMTIALFSFIFRTPLTYKFIRINLQCHVPTKYKANTALGRWVSTQRAEYKKFCEGDEKTSMTTEKIRRLEEIGFAWFMAL